jgi:NDP-sugar pyrophosphorylase family protein
MTDSIPKALIEINQKTLLERVILKLRSEGITQIIINTHHLASQIESFLKNNDYFDTDITLSYEEKLLDTGGGLKKAARFFDEHPFIIHNVDILSDISLKQLNMAHKNQSSLATLAVKFRKTKRYLLFDKNDCLAGRQIEDQVIPARKGDQLKDSRKYSFLGIHVVSPKIFKYFPEKDTFSILDLYLNAAAAGEKVGFALPDHSYWFDLGKRENLEQAGQVI